MNRVSVRYIVRVYHPWWMSMLFHRRGLLWLGSAVRYIWWQRWDNDNCQTGVALSMHIQNQIIRTIGEPFAFDFFWNKNALRDKNMLNKIRDKFS